MSGNMSTCWNSWLGRGATQHQSERGELGLVLILCVTAPWLWKMFTCFLETKCTVVGWMGNFPYGLVFCYLFPGGWEVRPSWRK